VLCHTGPHLGPSLRGRHNDRGRGSGLCIACVPVAASDKDACTDQGDQYGNEHGPTTQRGKDRPLSVPMLTTPVVWRMPTHNASPELVASFA
jgi:hypothetical protein